jgi:hypothetical protein
MTRALGLFHVSNAFSATRTRISLLTQVSRGKNHTQFIPHAFKEPHAVHDTIVRAVRHYVIARGISSTDFNPSGKKYKHDIIVNKSISCPCQVVIAEQYHEY